MAGRKKKISLTINGLAQDDKPLSQRGVEKEEKATAKRKLSSRTKILELVYLKTKILPTSKVTLLSLR